MSKIEVYPRYMQNYDDKEMVLVLRKHLDNSDNNYFEDIILLDEDQTFVFKRLFHKESKVAE